MIIEEAYGAYLAECKGCPKRKLGRRRDDGSVYAFSAGLRRKGWKKTNFRFNDLGDTYLLWCPDCWPLIRALSNFDPDGNWLHARECPDWAHARNGHRDSCATTSQRISTCPTSTQSVNAPKPTGLPPSSPALRVWLRT